MVDRYFSRDGRGPTRTQLLIVAGFALLLGQALLAQVQSAGGQADGQTAPLRPPHRPLQETYAAEVRQFERALALATKDAAYFKGISPTGEPIRTPDQVLAAVTDLDRLARATASVSLDFLERAYPRPGLTRDFLGYAQGDLTEHWQNELIPAVSGARAYYASRIENPELADQSTLIEAEGIFARFQTWFRANRTRVMSGVAALPK